MDLKGFSSNDGHMRLEDVRSRSVELNHQAFVEHLKWRRAFSFGLPITGWIMLFLEIIPTFVYFALAHFHLRYHGIRYFIEIDYMMHFYAIICAVPTVFLIAVLSDGYVYGKVLATVIVLSLASLAGTCSILITLDYVDSYMGLILMRISVFSVYFYFVAIPIRMSLFADLVTHNKNQPNARKCFTLLWVCNMTGAAVGLKIFKYFFDTEDKNIISQLTISFVSLTIIYFFSACLVAATLPLQLQTTNLFLYHMKCFCFAIGQQPSCKNWDIRNPGQWLETASKKFTWTEIKRTKSIYYLSLYIIPVACYFDCQSLLYFNWYSTRKVFFFGGDFLDDYSFLYFHMIGTSVIALIVQFIVLPFLSMCVKTVVKDSWIFFAGYLFLGAAILMLLVCEVTCYYRYPSNHFKPDEVSIIRLINGYPHEIGVLSDWNKKLVTIRPGELIHMKVNKEKVITFGETAIFRMPEVKMVDLIATTVKKDKCKNYLVRGGGYEVIKTGEDRIDRSIDKLNVLQFNGTLLILCSSELSKKDLTIQCYYIKQEEWVAMPKEKICRSQVDYSSGSEVKTTIPTVVQYHPRKYQCHTSDGQIHELVLEPKVFLLLYYLNDPSPMSKEFLLPKVTNEIRRSFVQNDLTYEKCYMPLGLLLLQIGLHAVSTSCILVSANTMVCLYGPPRLRMVSYSVLYVGVFTGLAVIRMTILANLKMTTLCFVHLGIYTVGLVLLFYNVLYVKFELHVWEQPWRPSILWKFRLCVRNRVLYKKFLSEKGPLVVSNQNAEKSILQSDVVKDRRSEEDKAAKKVTFHAVEVEPSFFNKGVETAKVVPADITNPVKKSSDPSAPP